MVYRVRKQLVEEGLEAVLSRRQPLLRTARGGRAQPVSLDAHSA
jgi:hypothetical protein